MEKIGTLFRAFIACVLPALLLSSYLADIFLVVEPADKVFPLFEKDMIRLTVFAFILGFTITKITEYFDLTEFRYYPLFGMVGYFILNGLHDIFKIVQSGKPLIATLPTLSGHIIPSLFLGAGFGILYWILAVQKSAQIALMAALVILVTSLFYIKEILGLFFI